MEACPVGAITLLANKAVQIHRDRCIGCAYCAKECPFQVIDMYQPVSPEEGRGPTQKQIATKCDLCLTDQNDPPCVVSCPYGATQRVQTHEFFPGIKGWATFSDGKGA
jgi:Fe-S-cluster-containing hydrogenase component 2